MNIALAPLADSACLSRADLRFASALLFLDFLDLPVAPFLRFLDLSEEAWSCCLASSAIAFWSSSRSAAIKFEYSDALERRKSS